VADSDKDYQLPELAKLDLKDDNVFMKTFKELIACAQKEYPAGPPAWLKERLDLVQRIRDAEKKPRLPLPLPLEAWPAIVPVATKGEGKNKTENWIGPVQYEGISLKLLAQHPPKGAPSSESTEESSSEASSSDSVPDGDSKTDHAPGTRAAHAPHAAAAGATTYAAAGGAKAKRGGAKKAKG